MGASFTVKTERPFAPKNSTHFLRPCDGHSSFPMKSYMHIPYLPQLQLQDLTEWENEQRGAAH